MGVISGRSLKYLAGFAGSLREKFGDFSRHHELADVTDWGAQAASLPRSAASRNASRMHNRRTSRSVRGKLPQTTGRRPVLPGRLLRREGGDDFFEARIAAQRIFSELWNFQVSCSGAAKISSLAGRSRTGL